MYRGDKKMCLECLLIGILIGVGLMEALLILRFGWGYEEKLRIYDKKV